MFQMLFQKRKLKQNIASFILKFIKKSTIIEDTYRKINSHLYIKGRENIEIYISSININHFGVIKISLMLNFALNKLPLVDQYQSMFLHV